MRLIPAHAGKTDESVEVRRSRGAHPRSRGENRRNAETRARLQGSSPLTRGKPPHDGAFSLGGRLIPAHAGKTE